MAEDHDDFILRSSDSHEKTKSTALDAFSSKVSATRLGYYEDKYLPLFLRQLQKDVRKQPIINRGYYTRVQCMRKAIDKFLELSSSPSSGCQIINIGAGFDTMGLHLAERNHPNLTIFEVDFPDLILKKANLLLQARDIHRVLFPVSDGDNQDPLPTFQSVSREYGYQFNQLKLISSNLFLPDELIRSLLQANFQSSLPTLILTECVLVYLNRESVNRLLSAIFALFPEPSPPPSVPAFAETQTEERNDSGVVWISYDMVHPHDSFGKMMKYNLESIGGFNIPGFTQYPDLLSHSNRFLECGCDVSLACTMLSVYSHLIPSEEKLRINRIEPFDEIEEWELLMSHYCVSLGIRGLRGREELRNQMRDLLPNDMATQDSS